MFMAGAGHHNCTAFCGLCCNKPGRPVLRNWWIMWECDGASGSTAYHGTESGARVHFDLQHGKAGYTLVDIVLAH